MIKPIFKPFLLPIIAVIAICFSSCDPNNDGPVIPAIVGTWQLSFNQNGPIGGTAVDKYAFYIDGTGSYGYYDRFNYWTTVPFNWDVYSSFNENVVVIDYNDGYKPVRSYYSFENGYLYFWDAATPQYYNAYARVSQ